jgi:hypothetical protein
MPRAYLSINFERFRRTYQNCMSRENRLKKIAIAPLLLQNKKIGPNFHQHGTT